MKEYLTGFFAGVSICLAAYIGWEHHRHVPVIIKEIKIKVPVPVPIPVPTPPTLPMAKTKAPSSKTDKGASC